LALPYRSTSSTSLLEPVGFCRPSTTNAAPAGRPRCLRLTAHPHSSSSFQTWLHAGSPYLGAEKNHRHLYFCAAVIVYHCVGRATRACWPQNSRLWRQWRRNCNWPRSLDSHRSLKLPRTPSMAKPIPSKAANPHSEHVAAALSGDEPSDDANVPHIDTHRARRAVSVMLLSKVFCSCRSVLLTRFYNLSSPCSGSTRRSDRAGPSQDPPRGSTRTRPDRATRSRLPVRVCCYRTHRSNAAAGLHLRTASARSGRALVPA